MTGHARGLIARVIAAPLLLLLLLPAGCDRGESAGTGGTTGADASGRGGSPVTTTISAAEAGQPAGGGTAPGTPAGDARQPVEDQRFAALEELSATLATARDPASAKVAMPKVEAACERLMGLPPPGQAPADRGADPAYEARAREVMGPLVEHLMRVGSDPALRAQLAGPLERAGFGLPPPPDAQAVARLALDQHFPGGLGGTFELDQAVRLVQPDRVDTVGPPGGELVEKRIVYEKAGLYVPVIRGRIFAWEMRDPVDIAGNRAVGRADAAARIAAQTTPPSTLPSR